MFNIIIYIYVLVLVLVYYSQYIYCSLLWISRHRQSVRSDLDTVFLLPENPIDHRALHNRSLGWFGRSWSGWSNILIFFSNDFKVDTKTKPSYNLFFPLDFLPPGTNIFHGLKKIYIYRLFCSNQKKSWSSLLSSSSKLWRMRTARSPPMDVLSIRSTFLSFNYFLLF